MTDQEVATTNEDQGMLPFEEMSEADIRKLAGGHDQNGGLTRLSINHAAEAEDGTALPRGKWMIQDPEQDGKTIFADEVIVQLLAKRFSYSVWDNDENKFSVQTVHTSSLNEIFYDSAGGYKCGKLSKDEIEALPKKSPEAVAQAAIKCNQILYGIATINKGVGTDGKKATCDNVPFVWYTKGMSYMPVSDYLKILKKQKKDFYNVKTVLGTPERVAKGKNVYYHASQPTTDGPADFGKKEYDTMLEFNKISDGFTQRVMADFHKNTNEGKDIDLAAELEEAAA